MRKETDDRINEALKNVEWQRRAARAFSFLMAGVFVVLLGLLIAFVFRHG